MEHVPNISLKVDCRYCPIRHRAICARCEPDELEVLNGIKYYKVVPAGRDIARAGDNLDFVASVVSGVAMLNQSLEDGRTQMVGLLLPSDFLGRPGRASVGHDVGAVTDVTLCCFHRGPFEKLLRDMPHVRERLLEMALDELDAAREWMLLLGRKSAKERIASLLLLVQQRSVAPGNRQDEDHADRIELPLSREQMANYLGLTLETVSRQLAALRRDGVIELEGARTITIPDVDALISASGQTPD